MKQYQKTDKTRNKKIIQYLKKGYSYAKVAAIFHLSRERIRQIKKKSCQLLDKGS